MFLFGINQYLSFDIKYSRLTAIVAGATILMVLQVAGTLKRLEDERRPYRYLVDAIAHGKT